VPNFIWNLFVFSLLAGSSLLGFLTFDYLSLRNARQTLSQTQSENQGLKGEARVLSRNLEDVRNSLQRVRDYTAKLGELTQAKVQVLKKETGIGPLTDEEHKIQQRVAAGTQSFIPAGLNLDKLVFRPLFGQMRTLEDEANQQALALQQLLSTLSQQKTLLASIPSITPVNGWITSGFGHRVSPFTGEKSMHRGLDIAAPVGTPITAPASGVVIFSGTKDGFGNFIMIAHGYGIVTAYGHNHQNMVTVGQQITRGDAIATVGMSGRTTGPHLHYEIIVDGNPDNPKKFILDFDPTTDFAIR
jgi:murein DD-endopeptidase MepM/ murein hydrolase activator NlpD